MSTTTIASILHRADRTAAVAGLAGVTALAWLLTVQLASTMHTSSASMERGMDTAMPSTAPQLWLVSAMWAAMMVGMMVPSATPMVVAFTDWSRRGPSRGSQPVAVAWFVTGYLIVWLGFSLVAASIQVTLERAGVHPVGHRGNPQGSATACWFRDVHTPRWRGTIRPRTQSRLEFGEHPLHPIASKHDAGPRVGELA